MGGDALAEAPTQIRRARVRGLTGMPIVVGAGEAEGD
jgi:hypothetical protein